MSAGRRWPSEPKILQLWTFPSRLLLQPTTPALLSLSIEKIHSGEKSNKCNQCEYASFHADDLWNIWKVKHMNRPLFPLSLPCLAVLVSGALSLLNFDSSDSIYLPTPRLESLCLPTTDEIQNPYLKFVINKSSHCLCYNLNQPKFTNREAVKKRENHISIGTKLCLVVFA